MGNLFMTQDLGEAQKLVRDRSRKLESDAARRRAASDQVTAHLADVRMFATCGKKELRAIAKTAKFSTVHTGTQIITEGDDGNTMFVVLTGSARVSRGGRTVAKVGAGGAFGELALLSNGPRTATVVALSEMEVAIITRRQLTGLLASAPGFSRKLLESLADIVRDLDKKVV